MNADNSSYRNPAPEDIRDALNATLDRLQKDGYVLVGINLTNGDHPQAGSVDPGNPRKLIVEWRVLMELDFAIGAMRPLKDEEVTTCQQQPLPTIQP